MSDELTPQEVEAIRAVILSGVTGDFQDVAEAVRKQYRIQIGAGHVEEVYREMLAAQQAAEEDAANEEAAGVAGEGAAAATPQDQAAGEESLRRVLRFAEEMGGFDQARAALDAVEKKLRDML